MKSNQIGFYFILDSKSFTVHPKSNMIQQPRRSRIGGGKRRIRLLFQVPSSYLSLATLLLLISILAVQVQVQVQVQAAQAQVQVQIATTVMIFLVHIFPSHITTSLSLLPPSFPSSSSTTLSTSTSSTRINQQQNEDNNNNNPNMNIPPPIKSTDKFPIPIPQPPTPATPCTRICRYNINCYDGNVCIGCFRDTHDISHWSCFSSKEKQFSLEDAADRCHDQQQQLQQDQDQQMELSLSSSSSSSESLLSPSSSSSESESGTHYYEGSISENELRKQAKMWGQL